MQTGLRLPLCAALITASLANAQQAASQPTVRDSAGVRIVTNPTAADRAAPRWIVDTTPAVTIRPASNATDDLFAGIQNVLQLASGHIVAVDYPVRKLRIFDSTGRALPAFGRLGSGPGEFRNIQHLSATGGDTFGVVDVSLLRTTWFSAMTGLLRTEAFSEANLLAAIGAQNTVRQVQALGDSVLFAETFVLPPGAPRGTPRAFAYNIVDQRRKTALRIGPYVEARSKVVQLSTGPMAVSSADRRQPVFAIDVARRRVCGGSTNVAVIDCVSADGSRMSIRWSAAPPLVSDSVKKAYADAVRASVGRGAGTAQDAELRIAATEWPDRVMPFDRITIDAAGNLWVVEKVLDAGGKELTRYRIFDATGRQVAFANFRALFPFYIGIKSVIGVLRDSDDVERIGVFTIRR